MKKGWVIKPLGDVFETVTGNTPSKSNAEYYGRYIPLVKPPELQDCELSDAEDGLSEEGARVARVALPSSILVSCIGNLGKIGFNTVPVAFNQQINAIIPDRSHAIPEFFFYQVLSCRFRDQLESLASGTTVSIVNKSRFNSIEIVLPPLPEQQRIVGLLDEAFGGLATAQAHAAQNLQNARDLFESCIQVEVGKDVALGEFVDIKTGKLDANAAEEDGKYPFFTCSRETYAINNYAFDCEAVLLAGNNAVGDFNVKHYIGKFNAYQRTYVITVNSMKRAISRYLYYQLQKNLAKFKSQSVGTGTKFLKLGMIKDMMIPLPTIPEQSRIVTQLDALAAETQRLARIYEQKLAALTELKKSLLHQAFSGEL